MSPIKVDELAKMATSLEKMKYNDLYLADKIPTSLYAGDLGKFVSNIIPVGTKVLELGCGRAQPTQFLIDHNYNCRAIDITSTPILEVYPKVPPWFTEATIWDLPFKDNEFGFTFSTDLLEHIPLKLLDMAIKEIYRVTNDETFHAICCLPNAAVHMTAEYTPYWKKRFAINNDKDINTHIIEARSADTLYYFVNKRRR